MCIPHRNKKGTFERKFLHRNHLSFEKTDNGKWDKAVALIKTEGKNRQSKKKTKDNFKHFENLKL